MVENVMPTARFATMNKNVSTSSNGTLPTIGTSNRNFAASKIRKTWM